MSNSVRSDWMSAEVEEDALILRCRGAWTVDTAASIDAALGALHPGASARTAIDVTEIERLDTAGAWLIERTRRRFEREDRAVELHGATAEQAILLDRLRKLARDAPAPERRYSGVSEFLHRIGKITVAGATDGIELVRFLGLTTAAAARWIFAPRRIRLTALFSHLESSGLNALPIVGLLSFIIGVVLAYQGADQLRRFGAEIFTVDLLGVSILREMGILMTAIIVAGRSGSAFTAQIGTMQVNEEIDAMRTIGLDPVEVLVLPRALALVITLPLLTVYANFMGLLGGCVMVMAVLDISVVTFTERLQQSIPIWSFWVGLIKAPVFGFVIALIGCREGLKVSGSAESVGGQTTRSVVISIFAVMVLDAIFSIFFSAVGV